MAVVKTTCFRLHFRHACVMRARERSQGKVPVLPSHCALQPGPGLPAVSGQGTLQIVMGERGLGSAASPTLSRKLLSSDRWLMLFTAPQPPKTGGTLSPACAIKRGELFGYLALWVARPTSRMCEVVGESSPHPQAIQTPVA